MPKRTRDYRESLLEDLREPQEATAYLNAALEDSYEMFLIALRDVAEARQMAKVASDAGVAREALYKTLSKKGNPRYTTLSSVLAALGIRIWVAPIEGTSGFDRLYASSTSVNPIRGIKRLGNRKVAKRKGP